MGVIGEGSSRSPVIPNKDRPSSTDMQAAALPLPPPPPDGRHYATSTAAGSAGPAAAAAATATATAAAVNSIGLMEVWASVASWFFRPECSSLLTTMAGADPSFATAAGAAIRPPTTTTTSQLPPASLQPSTTTTSPSGTTTTSASASSSSASMGKSSLHYRDPPTRERVFQAPTICAAIRCTVPSCSCECFIPGKRHLRYCETCKHGWVPHALDKLGTRHLFANSAPEPVQPNAAFDIASLVLYGCQALPIRLKILLDRLFSVLQKEQVLQVLHGFGWTPDDYARGYILQDSHAVSSLDRWSICSPEEEPLVLQQFLRFGETRAITQQLLLAQQVLQQQAAQQQHQQEATLERLDRLVGAPPSAGPQSQLRPRVGGAMSPSRRTTSPPPVPPSAFHPSRLNMSPHQKHLSFLKLPPTSNGPSSATTTSPGPRHITSSPLNTSPLNRLQSMQPFDFRKIGAGLGAVFPQNRLSPEMSGRRRTSEGDAQGLNLSMSTSLSCLPPPPMPPIPTSLNHSAAMAAAAASVNSLAAAGLVSTFPGLVSTRMSTGSKSPSTSDLMGNHFDAMHSDDDDIDENSHSALNLSRDHKDSQKTPRQSRGVPGRKPGTPTKRHWGSPGLPLNLGTQFINPATGKKRVQCNVCLKTFCDKGALKIHFSAVHLREMHKCTVEGCNMMFSSRRSRNRHSANPNPKLHSPHLRRKISPHDGRSSQAHPMMIPPQAGLLPQAAGLNHLNPFSPFPLLTPPPELRHPGLGLDFKHSLDLSMQRLDEKMSLSDYSSMHVSTSNHEDDDDDDDDDGIVVVGGDEDDESSERIDTTNGGSDQPEDFSMPTKRPKMSGSDFDEDITSNIDSNEDSLSVVDTHSLKDTNEECVLPTNKRKRKSQNPTRCTFAAPVEDPPSDGDSSNDVFVERISIKRECDLKEIKPNIEQVEKIEERHEEQEAVKQENVTNSKNDDAPPSPITTSPLNLGKRSPDVNANEPETASIAPLFALEQIKRESAESELDRESEERPASSVASNKSDEYFDCSNALRQLESLSHGNFGDLVMSRGIHLGLGGGHQASSQFAPLGFLIAGGPPSPARSQASSTSSAGSSHGGESPDESSQHHVYGHFDNGQFISTMDVPIDKDNPRRCTACGKIFQNHFGVKTHYQNVHLKLMHKCNVDGCNAAFPSKRSRDRHSANLNLHRKLLSTSSDKSPGSLFMDKSPFASLANSALHGDLLARLYSEDAFKGHPLPHPAALEQLILSGERLPPPPLLLPPLGGLPFPLGGFTHFPQLNGSSIAGRRERSSGSNSPLSASPPPALNNSPGLTTSTSNLSHCIEEDMPSVDKEGNLPCRLCRMAFASAQQLKDHCEKHHLYEMHKCTVPGCLKVFLSKTKRNLHADNDALHQRINRKGFETSIS